MDQEITNPITVEDELEAKIVEAAAIQEMISDKISQVKRLLDKLTRPTIPTTLNVSAAEFVPPQQPSMTITITYPITYPTTTSKGVARFIKVRGLKK